jgi:hypothetical protein
MEDTFVCVSGKKVCLTPQLVIQAGPSDPGCGGRGLLIKPWGSRTPPPLQEGLRQELFAAVYSVCARGVLHASSVSYQPWFHT